MKISLQHHAQHTLLMMGWFIVALAIPLTGQAMERQSVTVTVAPHGAYTLRGDQNAVAVRTQSDGLQVTYKSPAGLNLLSFIAFDGCLHLEQFEAHVCLLNTGATTGRVTALGKNIELAPGTSIDITGNPTQVAVVNTTSLRDSAAWAASDVYLNTLAETKVLGEAGKEAALLLESTYQAAFAEALQQKYSAQKAAQRAQDAVANLDLPQEITQAVDLLAETASSQIIAAAENMLKQASTVQVDGQRLAIGEAAQARAPISVSSQRFTLEPGQRGVVLVDTGFRPAVNGFSFTNYGGEYPHGDLTADDARIIFGAQACAAANTDECLASPAAYVWVSRMNRVLKYGHCEGMAVLSALLFTGQEQPQHYGGQTAVDLRPSRPTLIRAIGQYAAMQMLTPVWDEAATFRAKPPAEIVDILTGALKKNLFYTMGLYSSTGAQTVLPYAVEDVGNGSVWVHVYDPNYPQEGKYVEIDPVANLWRYDGLEGGTGTIDLTAVATRQHRMLSPFAPTLSATLLLIDSQTADLAITASDGKTILVVDKQIFNQIPSAAITRLRGKEKFLPDVRGASLGQQEGAEAILPILVSLPVGQEYLVSMSVAGELLEGELAATPDDLKGKEKLLLLEEERGKEKLLLPEERGKEKLLLEEERGKEKLLLEEERGKEKLLLEEERGKEKLLLEEERGKEKLLLEEERGAAGEIPTNPIWMAVFQANQAYLFDRITLKPGTTEQILLTTDGAVRYHAGTNQQLTLVAGSAVTGRANARYTIKKILLNPGYDFTIGQQPATGQTWFRTNDPAIEALDATVRVEHGQTSQRYAYKTLATPMTGQYIVAVHADGRFQIGTDANLDGLSEEQIADADADGIPDGFTAEDANTGVIPGAQGKLVADTGFRPNQHGFSFENYAKNQYPYGDLTIDDAWRMFGNQVCETVKNGECYPAPATQLWVEKMNASMQRGHCEGMAVLSMWLYTNEEMVAGFSGKQAYLMDPSYETLLRKIAYYWTTQTLEPVKSSYLAFREKTPTQILHTLIDVMNAKTETYTIGIYGRGGHAVTPYAVEDIGQGIFWVHVYDNNYPGVGKYIEINTNADTWKYAGAALNPADDASPWEGGTGKIDLTPSSVRRQPLTCSFCQQKKSAPETVTVMVDGNGVQVTAATPDGKKISMMDGQVQNQIPGAQITSIKGSDESDESVEAIRSDIFDTDRMLLLTLPTNIDYNISFSSDGGTSGETAWVGIIQEGVMFAIDNIALGDGLSDLLTIFEDGMVGYIPGQLQHPTLSVGTNLPGKDGLYVVSNTTLNPNGGGVSMRVDPETGALDLQSNDPGMATATVSVTSVDGMTAETIIYNNLPLPPGIALLPTIEGIGRGTAGTDDAQAMITEFQGLNQDAVSSSSPDSIGDSGEVDLPEPGGGEDNSRPQRVRIPVIINP